MSALNIERKASTPAPAPAVCIRGLRKSYGAHEVLKGIDLDVQPGEVIAIIGRSGSGKSTLLRCINGLETFQHGALHVFGQPLLHGDAAAMRALRQQVGMIFQSFNLFPHLSVGRNVMLAPGLVRKIARDELDRQARALLARVGLADKFDARPDQLSGGQQQRVAIARALAMQPRILLCDEITSALDPELVGEVLAVVQQLAADGMTMILVTHEMSFARDVGTRVVFMEGGRIACEGPAREMLTRPSNERLRAFLSRLDIH